MREQRYVESLKEKLKMVMPGAIVFSSRLTRVREHEGTKFALTIGLEEPHNRMFMLVSLEFPLPEIYYSSEEEVSFMLWSLGVVYNDTPTFFSHSCGRRPAYTHLLEDKVDQPRLPYALRSDLDRVMLRRRKARILESALKALDFRGRKWFVLMHPDIDVGFPYVTFGDIMLVIDNKPGFLYEKLIITPTFMLLLRI